MKKSARTCKKGFPCGKTCISKSNKCWANLSSDKQKVFETYGQFVNDKMSSIPSASSPPVSDGQKAINEIKEVVNKIDENAQQVMDKYPILGEENATEIEDKVFNDLESKGFSPDEYSQQVENNSLFISVDDPEDSTKVRDITVKSEDDGSTTMELSGSVKSTVEGEDVSIVDNSVPFADEKDVEQTSKLIDVAESNLPVGTEIKVPINVEGGSKDNAKKLLEDKGYTINPEENQASKTLKAQPEEIVEGKMGAGIRQRAEAGEGRFVALDNGNYLIDYDEYSLDKDEDGKVYLKNDKGERIPHVIMEMKGDIANIDEKEVFEKQFSPYRQTKTGLESEPGYVKDPEYGAMRDKAKANNAKLKEVKEQKWEVVDNPTSIETSSFTDTKNVKVVKGADGKEYKTDIRTGGRTNSSGTKLISVNITMEDDKGRDVSALPYLAKFEIPKREWDAMTPEEQQAFLFSRWSAIFGG